jgi:hypothetical protein
MKFNKFVPLTKMEEQGDGSLFVYGLVTEETPDLDNEVCDYSTTAPLYQKRTEERRELTSKIEGMTPSLMAMRAQHDPKQAIGAGRSIVCDDTAKTIKMGFHIVDSEAVKKWKTGIFVGFSQGGEYVSRWDDPVYKGCTRYTADPMEVSSVDSPCLPSALAESMKGRTVTLTKSAGTSEEVPLVIASPDEARMVKAEREITLLRSMLKSRLTKTVDGEALTASQFAQVGNDEEPITWTLPIATKAQVEAALKTASTVDIAGRRKIVAAAKTHGIDVNDADKSAISRACAKISLEKGLYEVGWMASLLEDLHWLCLQTEFERDMEDDGSKVPAEMREAWLKLIGTFKEMAIEEADELAAAGKGEKGMKLTDLDSLKKAAKTIHDHLEGLKEKHAAMGEHMDKCFKSMGEKHEAVGEHIEKCMKAAKDGMEGEEPEKAEPVGDVAKVEDPRLAAMQKSIDDMAELLKKLPANGTIAHTGVGNDVTKSAGFEDLFTN